MFRKRSSLSRKASSAFLRSVISTKTARLPRTSPLASEQGTARPVPAYCAVGPDDVSLETFDHLAFRARPLASAVGRPATRVRSCKTRKSNNPASVPVFDAFWCSSIPSICANAGLTRMFAHLGSNDTAIPTGSSRQRLEVGHFACQDGFTCASWSAASREPSRSRYARDSRQQFLRAEGLCQ